MDAPRDQPTALELEQWLLEEQTSEQRSRTEARLSMHEREQLRREDAQLRAELFARRPFVGFTQSLRVRAASAGEVPARAPGVLSRRWAMTAGLTLLLSAAGALALALFAVLPLGRDVAPSSERAKGLELDLRVYRRAGHGAERLRDGDQVRAHDVLQLGYIRTRYAFGVLLSIDGRGTVTLHQPQDPSAPSMLPKGDGERLLDQAYELDDAPGFERFVFVASERPIVVSSVYAAAERLAAEPARAHHAPLVLPGNTVQRSLVLYKRQAE